MIMTPSFCVGVAGVSVWARRHDVHPRLVSGQ